MSLFLVLVFRWSKNRRFNSCILVGIILVSFIDPIERRVLRLIVLLLLLTLVVLIVVVNVCRLSLSVLCHIRLTQVSFLSQTWLSESLLVVSCSCHLGLLSLAVATIIEIIVVRWPWAWSVRLLLNKRGKDVTFKETLFYVGEILFCVVSLNSRGR